VRNKYSEIKYLDSSLEEYCDKNNVDFNYIKYKLKSFKNSKEKKLPLELQLQLAIKCFKKRNRYKNINYKNYSLIEYCKKEEIKYRKIADRCRYFLNKNKDFSLLTEYQIELFINNYYEKEKINNLRDTFNKLNNCPRKEYKNICHYLNINYDKIKLLHNKNHISIKNLVFIIWYSSDKRNDKGIYISQSRLIEVLNNKNLELNDLCGMYKSGNKEYLDIIIEREKRYLLGFIKRVIYEYNFRVYKSDYEDLLQEAQLILTKCLSRIVFSNIARIIRYIEKCVTMQILSYLKKNYSNQFYEYNDALKQSKQEKLECF